MPWYVKIMAILIVSYIISPIDIIPDFIPFPGLLDEIILVPILVSLMIKMIPAGFQDEYKQVSTLDIQDRRLALLGAAMILILWLLLAGFCVYYFEII